jgi:hypothetical protein
MLHTKRLLCFTLIGAAIALSGCASLTKPSDDKLASLPVVELGNTPPSSEFVLKIPAGKPISTKVTLDGTALVNPVEQTLISSVPRDIYVYKNWVSEDGRQWKKVDELFGVQLTVALPSTESPKGGDIHLTVNKKVVQ